MTIVPAIIQIIALMFAPESPRWLYLVKNDREQAEGYRILVMILDVILFF